MISLSLSHHQSDPQFLGGHRSNSLLDHLTPFRLNMGRPNFRRHSIHTILSLLGKIFFPEPLQDLLVTFSQTRRTNCSRRSGHADSFLTQSERAKTYVDFTAPSQFIPNKSNPLGNTSSTV